MSPPAERRGAPHSAVTAGEPKDREVSTSNCWRNRSSRPISSARPRTTSTCASGRQPSISSMRNAVRLSFASSRTMREADQHEVRTRPGSPPPVPRSMTECGGLFSSDSTAATNPRAWSICSPMGIPPKKPRSAERSRVWQMRSLTRRRNPASAPGESPMLLIERSIWTFGGPPRAETESLRQKESGTGKIPVPPTRGE